MELLLPRDRIGGKKSKMMHLVKESGGGIFIGNDVAKHLKLYVTRHICHVRYCTATCHVRLEKHKNINSDYAE